MSEAVQIALIGSVAPTLAALVAAWVGLHSRTQLKSIAEKVDGMNSALQAKADAKDVLIAGKDKLIDSKDAIIAQQDRTQVVSDIAIEAARKAPAE